MPLTKCRRAVEWMSRALDAGLPAGLRARLRLHLWFCPDCRRFRRNLLVLDAALKQAADREPAAEGPGLPADARDRITAAVRGVADPGRPG